MGGVLQKIGILFLLDLVAFKSTGITPVAISAFYLPLSVVSLFLMYRPIKNPKKHIIYVYLVYAALIVFYKQLGLISVVGFVGAGVWFSIAAQGLLGSFNGNYIRSLTAIIISTGILADIIGVLLIRFDRIYIFQLAAVSLLLSFYALIEFGKYPETISDIRLRFIPGLFSGKRSILIISIFISGGVAEAFILSRLHDWNYGAELYGYLIIAHSIFSILGLTTPYFSRMWLFWGILWYLSIVGVFYPSLLVMAVSYAGIGAAGTVLMREFRVYYLTHSTNPASSAATASVILSGSMALGAIAGVYFAGGS
jgi:hypothetical protein